MPAPARNRLTTRPGAVAARARGPVPGWQVRECYGGYYWEVFRDGIKFNGGLADSYLTAVAVAQFQLHDPYAWPRSRN